LFGLNAKYLIPSTFKFRSLIIHLVILDLKIGVHNALKFQKPS
jgi:hypothetical protein